MTPKYLPHICHFWYAIALFRDVRLREFGTKIILLHNSVGVPGDLVGVNKVRFYFDVQHVVPILIGR